LEHALSLLRDHQGTFLHADITLMCELPKIGPHRTRMQAHIAEMMGVDIGRVSIKATTTEGLGFTGRKEGIAAQAIVTVKINV
jgi:2-C-methyl-D-erythritol 4-phosphate cytidylyltransferase/2-C-methyl-D-erythritol 2,4-cyclodiphosphate synthase